MGSLETRRVSSTKEHEELLLKSIINFSNQFSRDADSFLPNYERTIFKVARLRPARHLLTSSVTTGRVRIAYRSIESSSERNMEAVFER